MPEHDHPVSLLFAVRDAGLDPPQLDRLRAGVQASVQSEIERELRGGVRRHRPAVWRVRRPAAGSLITVFSAFVTLGVALAAILLLAHTRTHAPEAGGSRADDGLIGKLAVLRRPQTTADRLPASVRRAAAQRGGGAVIPSLSRLVATTPHARLFLVVRRPAGGTAPFWSPSLGDQVSIISVVGVDTAETPPVPAADLDNSAEVMPSAGDRGFATTSPGSLFVAILPDGVARARWTSADQHFHPRRGIDVRPVNNVAYVPFTHRTSVLLRTTWYRSDETVVPTSDRALQRANAARDAILSARLVRYDERHSYQADPTLLSDFSVFAITSPNRGEDRRWEPHLPPAPVSASLSNPRRSGLTQSAISARSTRDQAGHHPRWGSPVGPSRPPRAMPGDARTTPSPGRALPQREFELQRQRRARQIRRRRLHRPTPRRPDDHVPDRAHDRPHHHHPRPPWPPQDHPTSRRHLRQPRHLTPAHAGPRDQTGHTSAARRDDRLRPRGHRAAQTQSAASPDVVGVDARRGQRWFVRHRAA